MADSLTFDEGTHTYRFGGSVVPGVTSILKPMSDFSRIDPQVLEAKADLGRRVHFACELHDEDDLDPASIEADVAPYFDAYVKFREDTGCEILAVEQKVYHPLMRYAGTLDRVLRIGNCKWMVDLKTCFTTPVSAGPQTAAYLRALADTTITRRAALRLKPDGTYRLEELNNPDDWSAFMACLTLRRFMEQHA